MENDHPDFLSTDFPRTLIVYGQVSNPVTVANNLNPPKDGQPFELTNYYAIISPSSHGLRISSPGWMDISPQQMFKIQSTDNLFHFCRQQIIRLTDPFSKPTRLFLERYLNFLSYQLENSKTELQAKPDEDELYIYKDWIFSAWLPMPNAHILLPPGFDENRPCFAELDVAFWSDGQLIGVLIDGRSTLIRSRQEKLDYLTERHPQFKFVKFPRKHLEEDKFPINLFPESFANYWRTLSLPHGPCVPETLFIGESKSH